MQIENMIATIGGVLLLLVAILVFLALVSKKKWMKSLSEESDLVNSRYFLSFLFQLPILSIWIIMSFIDPLYVPRLVFILSPIWFILVIRPFITTSLGDNQELDIDTFLQVEETEEPYHEAYLLVRDFEEKFHKSGELKMVYRGERKEIYNRYCRIKSELISRNDEIGTIYRDVFSKFDRS